MNEAAPGWSWVHDLDPAPAGTGQVQAGLALAAELEMFFSFAEPRDAPAEGWRSAESLYVLGDGPLDDLVESVRRRLGGCEQRVAASLLHQGYAARLLSPQIGCLALAGCVPAVPAGQLRWRRPDTEMIELALAPGPGWQAPARSLIELIISKSFDGHLRPLARALRARVRISSGLLRDNAASALVSALQLVDGNGIDDAGGWRALAAHALAQPALRGSGTLRPTEPAFIRRSCCLYYRTANGGKCGDCPLGQVSRTSGTDR